MTCLGRSSVARLAATTLAANDAATSAAIASTSQTLLLIRILQAPERNGGNDPCYQAACSSRQRARDAASAREADPHG